MSATPRIIPFDDIARIPLGFLVNDRYLQRDVHYTVRQATRDEEYPVIILTGRLSKSWKYNSFIIDDKNHIYFFDEGWPIAEVPEFLRPEDVIESGLYTLNYSEENLQRALRELQNEKATFGGMVQIEKNPDGSLNLDNTKPVRLPIQDMDDLERGLYCCDPHVMEVVGHVDIPFNKPLNRVNIDGGFPEIYNSVNQQWEPYGDQEYRPSLEYRPSFIQRIRKLVG